MKDNEMPGFIVKIFANWWCKLQHVVMWYEVKLEAFSVGLGAPKGVYWEENFSIC